MDRASVLTTFAGSFVVPEFRERFVHEALKKPRKLHERICHKIGEVLQPQYRDKKMAFVPNGPCLFLGWAAAIEELTWSEALKEADGGGILIIDASGRKFYAKTECEPRAQEWAGER